MTYGSIAVPDFNVGLRHRLAGLGVDKLNIQEEGHARLLLGDIGADQFSADVYTYPLAQLDTLRESSGRQTVRSFGDIGAQDAGASGLEQLRRVRRLVDVQIRVVGRVVSFLEFGQVCMVLAGCSADRVTRGDIRAKSRFRRRLFAACRRLAMFARSIPRAFICGAQCAKLRELSGVRLMKAARSAASALMSWPGWAETTLARPTRPATMVDAIWTIFNLVCASCKIRGGGVPCADFHCQRTWDHPSLNNAVDPGPDPSTCRKLQTIAI